MMMFRHRNQHTLSKTNASQAPLHITQQHGHGALDGAANNSTTSFTELSIEQSKQVSGGDPPPGRDGEIQVED